MVATDELFKLIKSLTKAEKTYFSRFSSYYIRGENNNYIRLFNVIDRQKVYDEAAVKKQFKGEAMLNQFPVAKDYLYKHILTALTHRRSGIDAELGNLLDQAVILYEKQLYKACSKILNKGINLAKKYDKHAHLIGFYNAKTQLLQAQAFASIPTQDIGLFFEEQMEAINNMKITTDYVSIIARLYSGRNKKGAARKNEEIRIYEKIINHPRVKNHEQLKLFNPLIMIYGIHYAYYNLISDHKKLLIYAKKRIELCESHPHHTDLNPTHYLAALTDGTAAYIKAEQFEAVPALLNKFDLIKPQSNIIEERIFCLRNFSALNYFYFKGDVNGLAALIRHIHKDLSARKELQINNFSSALLFDHAKACFILGENKWAKEGFNKILNDFSIAIDLDYHVFSRLILLLLYFETDDIEMIEYELDSIQRFLEKRDKFYRLEQVMVRFFKKVVKAGDNSSPAVKSELLHLHKELLDCSKNILEKTAMTRYFNLLKWVDSRIKGTSIPAEMLGKKYD